MRVTSSILKLGRSMESQGVWSFSCPSVCSESNTRALLPGLKLPLLLVRPFLQSSVRFNLFQVYK